MGTLLLIGAAVAFGVIVPVLGTWYESCRARRVPLRRAIARWQTAKIETLRGRERAKVRGVVVAREPLLTSPISRSADARASVTGS